MRALGVGGWLVRSGWIDPEVPLVPYLLLTSQNLEGANEASFQLAFVPALFSSGRCGIVTTPCLVVLGRGSSVRERMGAVDCFRVTRAS